MKESKTREPLFCEQVRQPIRLTSEHIECLRTPTQTQRRTLDNTSSTLDINIYQVHGTSFLVKESLITDRMASGDIRERVDLFFKGVNLYDTNISRAVKFEKYSDNYGESLDEMRFIYIKSKILEMALAGKVKLIL